MFRAAKDLRWEARAKMPHPTAYQGQGDKRKSQVATRGGAGALKTPAMFKPGVASVAKTFRVTAAVAARVEAAFGPARGHTYM